jgi:WD40 repeat protein
MRAEVRVLLDRSARPSIICGWLVQHLQPYVVLGHSPNLARILVHENRYRSSKATPIGSTPSHSPVTASYWRRGRTTRQSGCGTRQRESSCSSSKATPTGSAPSQNPTTGEQLQQLEGHTDWVRAVAFSRDGQLLASGSNDGTIRLWNPATGEQLQTFKLNITVLA